MSLDSLTTEIGRLEKNIGDLKAKLATKVKEADKLREEIEKENSKLQKKEAEYKKLANK
jgi:regulator of replication initiation timing